MFRCGGGLGCGMAPMFCKPLGIFIENRLFMLIFPLYLRFFFWGEGDLGFIMNIFPIRDGETYACLIYNSPSSALVYIHTSESESLLSTVCRRSASASDKFFDIDMGSVHETFAHGSCLHFCFSWLMSSTEILFPEREILLLRVEEAARLSMRCNSE